MAFYGQRQQQAAYGHCDSFFLEDDQHNAWYERKVMERERARQQAKERQRILAGELSQLTSEEYQDDILDQMEVMEIRTLPDVNSIDIQSEIQWFMRPYLLDFLVEAHSAFSLLPDTLYLAVNLLDRYCSRRVVYKRHYQLVGCAALLIAAKYGDRKDRVPQIKELKAMCCSLYEEDMFTQMEWHLLQTLDWTIGHPTVDSFLQVAISEGTYDHEVEHLAWYISELALFHKEFVSVLPSTMARSALSLSRFILSRPSPRTSAWADAYDPMLVARLYAHLQQPSTVVSKKYSAHQLSSVSVTVEIFIQRQAQLERERQCAPATPPVEVGTWTEVKPGGHSSFSPQTPQKMPYSSIVNHGLYTPPITPENDSALQSIAYAKHQPTLPPIVPGTPTPTANVERQHPLQHYQTAYEQLHQENRYWAT